MNILITNISRRVYFVDFLSKINKNLNIHLANNDTLSAALNHIKTKNHKIPLVSEGGKKYFNAIKKIVIKNKINLIIPLTNHDLKILSLGKKEMKKYKCDVLVSSYNLIKKLLDKKSVYNLCRKKNIIVPKTFFNFKQSKSSNVNLFIKKDRFGNASSGLEIIKNLKKHHFNKNSIVQELIRGNELHFDILNDFNGKYISSCVKKKISMRSGETDQVEIVYNKKLENIAKQISKLLGHIGNLDCDAIVDKKGKIYFLDFNPRFGGGYPFTHLAGLNFLKSIIYNIKKKKFNLPIKPKLIKASKGICVKICK